MFAFVRCFGCWELRKAPHGPPEKSGPEARPFDQGEDILLPRAIAAKERDDDVCPGFFGFKGGGVRPNVRTNFSDSVVQVVDFGSSPLFALQEGEYQITVDDGIGLEVEPLGDALLVAKIRRSSTVSLGDRILCVNNVGGNPAVLINELKRRSVISLRLKRAMSFDVSLLKNGQKLGISVVKGNNNIDQLRIKMLTRGVGVLGLRSLSGLG